MVTRPDTRVLHLLGAMTILVVVTITIGMTLAQADASSPNLGRLVSPDELSTMPMHVFPDGEGLPEGTGNSVTGKALYLEQCSACHGANGEGGTALELVGDRASLTTEYPDRGIAVVWPYAPTLFEYVRRSMPPDKPWSLSVNDVYAIIAYLLELNGLIQPGTEINKSTLSSITLPNRDGFVDPYQP